MADDRHCVAGRADRLVGHDWQRHRATNLGHRVQGVGRHRLLEELGLEQHDSFDESNRLLGAAHRHVGVHPHPVRGADRGAHLPHCLDVALEALPGLDLDGAKAFADTRERVLRHLLRLAVRDRVAERDPVAHLAAEQSMHRHPQCLAGDVPERHLHPRDRKLAVGKRALHGAQRARDCERVPADENGAEPLVDVAAQQRTAAGEHAGQLAQTGQPFVGVDLDDAVLGNVGVAERGAGDRTVGPQTPDADRRGLDCGDLHRSRNSSGIRARAAPCHAPRAIVLPSSRSRSLLSACRR